APGGPWLYAKFYGGPGAADRVLCRLTERLLWLRECGALRTFFFVRYADPDFHIRLRIESARGRETIWNEISPCLDAALAADEIWRVQWDTYEREIERYGGARGITLSERLFCEDSQAVLGLITTSCASEANRWPAALLGADRLIAAMGIPLEARERLITHARDALGSRLRISSSDRRAIGTFYRESLTELHALLEFGTWAGQYVAKPVDDRDSRLRPLQRDLAAAQAAGDLSVAIDDLTLSYVHMHINRVLIEDHARQELVIYDVLKKWYATRVRTRPMEPR
ncbi:MAG: thiopeptide-type bacteriocin biosynthesis protein, partial [Kofleriaceae bacterium]